MGLFLMRFRFRGQPPTEDIVKAALRRQVGSTSNMDSFVVNDKAVEIITSLDPVISTYVLKILLDLGGEYLDPTCQPREPNLPEYVNKPWREWPWWKRASIRVRSQLGNWKIIRNP
jgi:hypothetical protein